MGTDAAQQAGNLDIVSLRHLHRFPHYGVRKLTITQDKIQDRDPIFPRSRPPIGCWPLGDVLSTNQTRRTREGPFSRSRVRIE